MTRLVALGLAAAAACTGQSGTISVTLVTAPGSSVLDPVTRLRLTVTHPRGVFETDRSATGFDLSIELEATGERGELIVEGFEAGGALVATGMSPDFSVAALDGSIVIYVAAPMSIARAPVALTPPRSELAAAALPYGAMFAGGRDAAGAPSDELAIYNLYDHSLRGGMPMPVARAGPVIAATSFGRVYLFGGIGLDGAVGGDVLLFDTTVGQSGAYAMIGDDPGLARANQLAVPIQGDRFLITGTPPVELSSGSLAARTEVASLPPVGTSSTTGGVATAVFVGAGQITRFRSDTFDVPMPGLGRDRAGVAALPDGRIAVAGGGDAGTARDLVVFDPVTGVAEIRTGALTTGRFAPAVAATARHLVIVGGVDPTGAPIATAEVLDATTLSPLATIPVEPRAGTFAFAMPNGQVMIGGGSLPSALLELFTPDPPSL